MILEVDPQRIGETSTEKRGEPGTRRQASPDPHRPHNLKQEVQVVCE
jgi:hypothetical protein